MVPIFRAQWQNRAIIGLIFIFAVFLTLHAQLSRFNLDEYGDMTENYAWGMLWQWGYFKHPPLFGWLAAAWFLIFPHQDIYYYAFSALNAAVALFFLWRIARRYGDVNYQLFVIVAAMMIPPFCFQAIKYNANTAMTPLWAAGFLFYLRGLEGKRLGDAVMLGLIAGLSMLTKYYSVIFLLALLAHALYDRTARAILWSPFGLVAAVTSILVFSGHLIWLLGNDFLPVRYAAEQGDGSTLDFFASIPGFAIGIIGYMLPALTLALLMRNRADGYPPFWLDRVQALTRTTKGRALIAFAVLPAILTVILGFAATAQLSVVWALPIFSPMVLVCGLLLPADLLARNSRRIVIVAGVFFAILLISAPIYKESVRSTDRAYLTVPAQAVTEELDRLWAQYGEGARGAVLAGEPFLANTVSFYSRYSPLTLEANSLEIARPYMDRAEIDRRGFMVICRAEDAACGEIAQEVIGTRTDTVKIPFAVAGFDDVRQWHFDVVIGPPRR